MMGSGLLFLIVLLIKKRKTLIAMVKDGKTVRRLIVFGLGGLYMNQISYTITIGYTNAGTATVLQCTAIVFVMLYTCITFKRLPKLREFVGLLLAMGSTFILATHGNIGSLVLPLPGLIWGMINGIAAAFYIVYPRSLLKKWGSFAVTGLGMFAAGIGSTLIAQPWNVSVNLDGLGVFALAGATLLGTFGAYYLYLKGVSDIGPMRASLLGAIEPVAATFFSWAWLGTQFPLIDYVGFGMMVIMVFFVTSDGPTTKKLDVVDVPVAHQNKHLSAPSANSLDAHSKEEHV